MNFKQMERLPVTSANGRDPKMEERLRSNSLKKKIQIQMQKQEEETRLFNETMQEAQLVKHLAGGQSPVHQQQHHLLHHQMSQHQNQMPHVSRSQHLIPSFPPYPRGGSLPNVNQMANQTAGINLQSALDHLEILTSSDPNSHSPRTQRHPSPTPQTQSGQHRHYSPKRPMEYDVSRMPSYLSPPESSQLTKRAHSDSALHQSANGPHVMMHDPGSLGNFTPSRRSPVPEKMNEQNLGMWHDPTKMAQNQNRPKSCEIPVMSGYADQSRQQQHGQHGQHLLSPISIQSTPITNPSSGSLPDLTNPSMNFPTLVAPLDPEDGSQNFSRIGASNGHQQMYINNQIRPPGGHHHSPSASPHGPRRTSPMRTSTDSHKLSNQNQKQKSQHASPGAAYTINDRQGNHMSYAPYNQPTQNTQNFNSGPYRSNSSSPSVHEQLGVLPVNSNPSSPGTNSVLSNMSYPQDQQYLEMHHAVQQKFEQIDIEQSGGNQQLDPYMNLYDIFQRTQANDLGQIPDIIFTGADDHSGLRNDYSSFLASAGASSSHSFQHHSANGNDHYSSQQAQQDHVDLMADVFKLDQYDLGMLTDENFRNMVDPETEEQFRLDSNVQ